MFCGRFRRVLVANSSKSVVAVVAVLLVELVVVESYLIYSVRFVVFCFIKANTLLLLDLCWILYSYLYFLNGMHSFFYVKALK